MPHRHHLAGLDAGDSDASPEAVVRAYHERTKHRFNRHAASPGYLDWATEPDPFRRYSGAPLVRLPLLPGGDSPAFDALYGDLAPRPLEVASVSRLLTHSLAITAWKEYRGSRWALRANPSSGNLHPTEGYLLLPPLAGLGDRAALYHYAPREHGLERRRVLDPALLDELLGGLPGGTFLVGLASICWREAWKYGERAWRYTQHDVGHALAALRYGAALLGWELRLVTGLAAPDLEALLGLRPGDPDERERADLVALVAPRGSLPREPRLAAAALARLAALPCLGRPNRLSPEHVADWPVVETVADAVERHPLAAPAEDFSGFPDAGSLAQRRPAPAAPAPAERVILGRRSAQAFDAETHIDAAALYHLLGRTLPSRDNRSVPWDALPWRPRVHLGLLIHRVRGLAPGLYALARDPEATARLRDAMPERFAWERPAACPEGLPLHLLAPADLQAAARAVSCHQDIAADGVLAVVMLGEVERVLASHGAPFYGALHWEAGLVGQVLYLEAENAGIRATGIGCFFDDPARNLFGIQDPGLTPIYHFTMGGPLEDRRLATLPAYPAR